ncbi:MAG: hypothetical protein NTX15_01010 [Candidatus Kapabacteria bacterium]|nr:hypothetical protein [Candidatus Kapabacteria bacterium]
MRTLLLVFLTASSICMAQRPWLLESRASAGPKSRLQTISAGLFMFDTVAMRSYDHGANWETIPGLVGDVCAMSSFTAGLSLAVTQDASRSLVRAYFSTSGTTWTQFDSLTITSTPIQIATIGEVWYLATNAAKIYVFSTKLDSFDLGDLDIIDLVSSGTNLIASTSRGIRFSKDGGKNWESIVVDGLGTLFANGPTVYATSVSGVKKVDLDAKRVSDVGRWNSAVAPPACLDLDADQNKLYAFTNSDRYQLYRLDGDTVWTEVAYPLPGTLATITSSVMAFDAGWAVVNHSIIQGFTDSAGVYAYNLNDFTSVDEELSTGLTIRVHENTVHITCDYSGAANVTFFDVLGRIVLTQDVSDASSARIELSADLSGFLGVILRFKDGSVQRGHILY